MMMIMVILKIVAIIIVILIISGNKTRGGLHTNIKIKLKNYSNWQLYYEIIDHLNKWL